MSTALPRPSVIQGGMGVAVSGWRLARAVSMTGQLGVVSGTALDSVLVRRLQDGDPGGHLRRAMERFPIPSVAERALDLYYSTAGRDSGTPYRLLPIYGHAVSRDREALAVLANFVEVHLAKVGHDGPVGINLLTKIQAPNLASLYGAMLAGVDVVLMGAGIPRDIPAALDHLARHQPASISMVVEGGDPMALGFDPGRHHPAPDTELRRPAFLPIVSSDTLATMLARRSEGGIQGFVVEGPTAGGHNAPPRTRGDVTERGEPRYGSRDHPDLAKIRGLGLPFWLAGGVGSPDGMQLARQQGAVGVQVGTLFAWCRESGVAPEWKERVLADVREDRVDLFTDPRASPTGFPFKVVNAAGSIGDREVYDRRDRICDLGYLRTAYRRTDGRIGYRCPAEPLDQWIAKGGAPEEAADRMCLCNSLVSAVGLPQIREGGEEPALLTAGDDLRNLGSFLRGRHSYTAADVVEHLLGGAAAVGSPAVDA